MACSRSLASFCMKKASKNFKLIIYALVIDFKVMRVILKWIIKKWDGDAWTGLIWLRIGTSGGHLEMR